jgi:glutathione synthase/RimK-type ligase-like ATP-grasp enzyme
MFFRGGECMITKTKRFQQIASKGLKTIILKRDTQIKPYIPKTVWYREDVLYTMLKTYGTVFIKPDKGGGGVGIIRIQNLTGGLVECKSLKHHKIIPINELNKLLQSSLNPDKLYLIQQGIPLAKVKDRPFDIRLMLQRTTKEWELTGIAAKIAAPGKIVTNYCKGGQPYKASDAVRQVCGLSETRQKMKELKKLAYRVANVLSKKFKGLRELGIDAGMDNNGKIWIFEVNTRPTYGMFRKLNNLQMYYKIRKNRRMIV